MAEETINELVKDIRNSIQGPGSNNQTIKEVVEEIRDATADGLGLKEDEVKALISEVVDGAPETFDTLKEVADVLVNLKNIKDGTGVGAVVEGLIGDDIPEENRNVASGANAHAEGGEKRVNGNKVIYFPTEATGIASHAEGTGSTASGDFSHAEGCSTASGKYSHAEGTAGEAIGYDSHSEACSTASGDVSHAEGNFTEAVGDNSHAQNNYTIAQGKSQTAIGEYNVAQGTSDSKTDTDYAFIIGNGTGRGARSNAFAIRWDGAFVAPNNTTVYKPERVADLSAEVTRVGKSIEITPDSFYSPNVVAVKENGATTQVSYSGANLLDIANATFAVTYGGQLCVNGSYDSTASVSNNAVTFVQGNKNAGLAICLGKLAVGDYSIRMSGMNFGYTIYSSTALPDDNTAVDMTAIEEFYTIGSLFTVENADEYVWFCWYASGKKTRNIGIVQLLADMEQSEETTIEPYVGGAKSPSASYPQKIVPVYGYDTYDSETGVYSKSSDYSEDDEAYYYAIKVTDGDGNETWCGTTEKIAPLYKGDYIDYVSGTLVRNTCVIGSYNGETVTGSWLSNVDVYASNRTPSTGATVAYTMSEATTTTVSLSTDISALGNATIVGNGNLEITYIKNTVGAIPKNVHDGTGAYAVCEGNDCVASGDYSHCEGLQNEATETCSHAEGHASAASGYASHAEGIVCAAIGSNSHAEGGFSKASGAYSHVESLRSKATGIASHAEGTSTTASGSSSHSEGYGSTSVGYASHAQNYYTVANGFGQTAIGVFNEAQGEGLKREDTDYAFIIGNGTGVNARSNALAVRWDGAVVLADNTVMTVDDIAKPYINFAIDGDLPNPDSITAILNGTGTLPIVLSTTLPTTVTADFFKGKTARLTYSYDASVIQISSIFEAPIINVRSNSVVMPSKTTGYIEFDFNFDEVNLRYKCMVVANGTDQPTATCSQMIQKLITVSMKTSTDAGTGAVTYTGTLSNLTNADSVTDILTLDKVTVRSGNVYKNALVTGCEVSNTAKIYNIKLSNYFGYSEDEITNLVCTYDSTGDSSVFTLTFTVPAT